MWRDVRLGRSRLGSVELYDATMQSVQIDGSKLYFVNLRNATLTDVDLRSSDFRALHGVEGMRGCVIDDSQLSLMAPLFAAHLGIIVE